MQNCVRCGCSKLAHLTVGTMACLHTGCGCPGYTPPADELEPEKNPLMWAVRVDKGTSPGSYVFKVEPIPYAKDEIIALDAAPGLIGLVHAPDPGAAAARTWEKGCGLHTAEGAAPRQAPPGLGDKNVTKG